jgi:hypothetical protein
MEARLLSTASPEWAAALSRMTHDFYHLPAYAALQGLWEGGEAHALYVRDRQDELLMPLIVRSIPGGGRDARTPYGYAGPITTGSAGRAFVEAALLAGTEFLAAEGLVSLFVRLHPLLNADLPESVGAIVTHGDAIVVDLSLGVDELWRQTRSGHRSDINTAKRRGHRVIFDTDGRHHDDFDRLYRETMARLHASSDYCFDAGYFGNLSRALGDRLHLVAVDIDGVTAAAAQFVETCGIVQYHLSASDERYRKASPTKLMLHEVRLWAKSRGNRWLHLGGGAGGVCDTLLEFKAGYSSNRRPVRTLRIVLSPRDYERLLSPEHARSAAYDLTGYFPAYRHAASAWPTDDR